MPPSRNPLAHSNATFTPLADDGSAGGATEDLRSYFGGLEFQFKAHGVMPSLDRVYASTASADIDHLFAVNYMSVDVAKSLEQSMPTEASFFMDSAQLSLPASSLAPLSLTMAGPISYPSYHTEHTSSDVMYDTRTSMPPYTSSSYMLHHSLDDNTLAKTLDQSRTCSVSPTASPDLPSQPRSCGGKSIWIAPIQPIYSQGGKTVYLATTSKRPNYGGKSIPGWLEQSLPEDDLDELEENGAISGKFGAKTVKLEQLVRMNETDDEEEEEDEEGETEAEGMEDESMEEGRAECEDETDYDKECPNECADKKGDESDSYHDEGIQAESEHEEPGPDLALDTAVRTTPTVSTPSPSPRASSKRARSWSTEEDQACMEVMAAVCHNQAFAGTDKRWAEVSRLLTLNYNIDRKPNGVKSQWNRRLRELARKNGLEIEDRAAGHSDRLVTSALPKSKPSRKSKTSIPSTGSSLIHSVPRLTPIHTPHAKEPITLVSAASPSPDIEPLISDMASATPSTARSMSSPARAPAKRVIQGSQYDKATSAKKTKSMMTPVDRPSAPTPKLFKRKMKLSDETVARREYRERLAAARPSRPPIVESAESSSANGQQIEVARHVPASRVTNPLMVKDPRYDSGDDLIVTTPSVSSEDADFQLALTLQAEVNRNTRRVRHARW